MVQRVHPFQHDDGRLIMKGLCNGTRFMTEKRFKHLRINLGIPRSAGHRLTNGAISGLLKNLDPCYNMDLDFWVFLANPFLLTK